jgi:predicted Rdx family selenoprotein
MGSAAGYVKRGPEIAVSFHLLKERELEIPFGEEANLRTVLRDDIDQARDGHKG